MLRERATEPEHFDDPARTPEEIAGGYRQLARVNRLFLLHDPYTRILAKWIGHANCTRLSILDLGAGDGWLGHKIEQWARKRGWNWQVTNLDVNRIALRLSSIPRNVVASVMAIPFQAETFDVVIASQMTHHLETENDVVQHLREARRVARQAMFITDMKRSAFLYGALWFVTPLLGLRPEMRRDGLLSVRRSWTRDEMAKLVARAGLHDAEVRSYFGTRLIIAAKKIAASAGASETSATYRATDEFCSAPSGR